MSEGARNKQASKEQEYLIICPTTPCRQNELEKLEKGRGWMDDGWYFGFCFLPF